MTLRGCIEQMPDPRRAEGRRYELTPLLIGTILAIAWGATSYRKVHRFLAAHGRRLIAVFGGRGKRAPAYTPVRNGLRELDPGARETACRAPSQGRLAAHGEVPGRCIAIDGKGRRASFDHLADPRAAQWRGALAPTEPILLAHGPIADKSNEIPAAQPLIAELGPSGCLLTREAEPCQKNLRSGRRPRSRPAGAGQGPPADPAPGGGPPGTDRHGARREPQPRP